ncbi:MAG TPA: hypothetical protein VHL59_08995, partial [Thermoanaerobaculia bacterium]|nr:hypothetical protein [Thermoanaerobaculia bacterium]
MRRVLLLALVLSAAFSFSQCGARDEKAEAPAPAATPAQLPVTSVTGLVLFELPDDQIYVPDFPVTLKGGNDARTATTNLLGQYRFENAAPG